MSDLRRRIDGRVVFVHPHGPEAVKVIEDTWERIASEFDALTAERVRIQESSELTPAGKEKEFARLEEKAATLAGRLGAIEANIRKQYDRLVADESAVQAGRIRDASGGYYADPALPKPAERTAETFALEREIRDRLQGEDPYALGNKYLAAVADGSDPLLVSAIENAPKALALVTDQARAQAREIRIARSPMAAPIFAARAVYDSHALLLEMSRSELYVLFPGLAKLRENRDREPLPKKALLLVPFGVEKVLKGLKAS